MSTTMQRDILMNVPALCTPPSPSPPRSRSRRPCRNASGVGLRGAVWSQLPCGLVTTIPEKPSLEGLEAKWRQQWDADGTYRWVLCRGVAIHDAEDKALRMAGSQTDITERKVADALTGLPNRLLFMDRLDRAIARADEALYDAKRQGRDRVASLELAARKPPIPVTAPSDARNRRLPMSALVPADQTEATTNGH